MGKYMKKSKAPVDVAVMEVSHSSLSGVRTRARALALQSLSAAAPEATAASASFLQLRGRRLQKPVDVSHVEASEEIKELSCKESSKQKGRARVGGFLCGGYNGRVKPVLEASSASFPTPSVSGSIRCFSRVSSEKKGRAHVVKEPLLSMPAVVPVNDGGLEASCGENVQEFEEKRRYTRESRQTSLIIDIENVRTTSATTRTVKFGGNNRRTPNTSNDDMPSIHEINKFFASTEHLHRTFSDKYNYDFVNDLPQPGRYEWERLA